MASVTSTEAATGAADFYENFSSKSGEIYARYIQFHIGDRHQNPDNVVRQAKISFLKEILTLFNDKNLTDEVQKQGDKFLLDNFKIVVGLYMKSLLKTHLVPRLNKVDLLWAKALKNAQSRHKTISLKNMTLEHLLNKPQSEVIVRKRTRTVARDNAAKNRTTTPVATVIPVAPVTPVIRVAGQDNAARNKTTMGENSTVWRGNHPVRATRRLHKSTATRTTDLTDITSTALTLFRINNDGMNPPCRNYLTRGGYSKYVQKKNQVIGFTATEYTIKKKNEIKEYLGDAESASLVELYFKECGSVKDVEQYDSLYVFEHFNDFGLPSIDISKRYLYSNEVIKRFTNKVLVPCPLCFTIGVEEACLGTELGHSLKQSKAAILYGFSYALECGRSRLLGEGARTNKLEVKDGTYYWEKEKDITKLCSNRHWFCCKECKVRRNTIRKTKKRKREPHEAFTRFEHLSMNYGLSIRVANVLKTLFDCSSPNYTIGEVVTKVYLNDEDATLKVSLEEINKIKNIQIEKVDNFVITASGVLI